MRLGSPLPHKKARIEIIPLIDIMFFLLASFMMVSLSMIKLQSIKMNLPTAQKAVKDIKPDMLNIAVNKAGDVYISNRVVDLGEVIHTVSNKFRANTNVSVYISGDKDASHGAVIRVLDGVKRGGVEKVSFAITPEEKK
jgi:biopolymer transport protein ExbD